MPHVKHTLFWLPVFAVFALLSCDDVVEDRREVSYTIPDGTDIPTLDIPLNDVAADSSNDADADTLPACGNGVAEPPEQCDGSDLAGESCSSLGLAGGPLACSSDCRFDRMMCSSVLACEDDLNEENDTRATATPIPSQNGSDRGILCSNDLDWYAFEFSNDARSLTVIVDHSGGEPEDLSMTLFQTSTGAVFFSQRDGYTARVKRELPEPGRYLVKLESRRTDIELRYDIDVDVGLEREGFSCPADDIYEENDRFEQAVPVVSNDFEDGVTCRSEDGSVDEDWFSIRAPQGAEIRATLLFLPFAGDLQMELYAPDGQDVIVATGPSGELKMEYQVPPDRDGLYRVRIFGDTLQYERQFSLETPTNCGNNLVEAIEVCDGTDLAGETCLTLGRPQGELRCNATCTGYDFTGCVGEP